MDTTAVLNFIAPHWGSQTTSFRLPKLRHRLPVADFTCFIACGTADVGRGQLPKGALHIATGFQFAGFSNLLAMTADL
ncbi:hypothetical protein CPB84DRAFT_1396262 [Gymnopilus junonius]|uniref:Uncharacterized protein n=1 Tax=Gymnopilus junonius TaxID=109634 RepID=A0A9P5NJG8_GYMJU|nr:hypothetical protein CPB84DRAFT_1396262 [Gymnopilus junonius]